MVDGGHLRDALHSLVDILVEIITDLERGKRDFSSPFENILRVAYFSTIYKQFDKLVSNVDSLFSAKCMRDYLCDAKL